MKEIDLDLKIYIVVCEFRNKKWGVAYFWNNMPYASVSFAEAHKMKRDIIKYATGLHRYWKKSHFALIKIDRNLLK